MDALLTGRVVNTPGAVRAGVTSPPATDERQLLTLAGTVDVRSVGELRSLLHAAIDAGRGPLHVDVGGLELADHAGVGVLLGGARRARSAGRSLVLLEVPAALWPLLAVDRLGRLLRVLTTAPDPPVPTPAPKPADERLFRTR